MPVPFVAKRKPTTVWLQLTLQWIGSMRQSSIPLIGAGVYTPSILAAQRIGLPAGRLLRQSRLPVDMSSVDPTLAVAARLAWQFAERVARLEEGALLDIHATQRLRKGTMSVAEIARQIGYGHISIFSKAFR